MLLFKGFLFWIGIALLEMVHGIVRARFLAPKIGDFKSRQIGVATGSLIILTYAWAVFPSLSLQVPSESFKVGMIWLLLMIIFEFTIGHFVFRFPWKWLLNDFNFLKGRLLAIGMLILLLAPWLAGKLHGSW